MFSKIFLSAAFSILLVSAGSVRAETTVDLKGTHLCCGACVTAVNKILKGVEGVTNKNDQKTGTISITAKDDATAQKALDALAAGGFHGKTDSKTLTQKDDSGATAGKVKTLTLTAVHNCCGSCNGKINTTIKGVAGVTAHTAKVRAESFEVTSDFDAVELIKALNDAGFHAKVKK
ncbi:MAG: hypothetical protein K8T89_11190 [Planctomycetes bacterium]|nr:hypothetical protein [Planctomycetota bacterium]